MPQWSGDTLDLVVDFTTYVFVPAYAISASGLLPQFLAIPAGIVVVISGALYFADRDMKTKDNYFLGFPALWNLAAFYLYLLEPPEWAAGCALVVLAGLSFAPIKFLHPLRVEHLRMFNVAHAGSVGASGFCRRYAGSGTWSLCLSRYARSLCIFLQPVCS